MKKLEFIQDYKNHAIMVWRITSGRLKGIRYFTFGNREYKTIKEAKAALDAIGTKEGIMTIANDFAKKMGDDGGNWNGFEELIDEFKPDIFYASRTGYFDDDGNHIYVSGYKSGYIVGDPIRYVFKDGSAIVEAGDAWDIEGSKPFSWKG